MYLFAVLHRNLQLLKGNQESIKELTFRRVLFHSSGGHDYTLHVQCSKKKKKKGRKEGEGSSVQSDNWNKLIQHGTSVKTDPTAGKEKPA